MKSQIITLVLIIVYASTATLSLPSSLRNLGDQASIK